MENKFHSFLLWKIRKERKETAMLQAIRTYLKKPDLFEKSQTKFWDDPHISQSMLKAHLDPSLESATRKLDFVKQSVDWISDILPPWQYKRLLDLGCGPGIYAELFNARGYQVTGVDISRNSIQYAKNAAKDNRSNIRYQNIDYIQSPIMGEYDLATMIYCDFGVLSGKEREMLLRKVYHALSPKGCFLFDVFTPFEYENRKEYKIWNYEESGFWRKTPYLLLQSLYRYDGDNTFLNQYIVAADGEIACYNNWEHTFEIKELETALLEAGFNDLQFFRNVTGAKYEYGNNTICAIAKKSNIH